MIYRDRHEENLDIVETKQGDLYLSPNFDNGLTLGSHYKSSKLVVSAEAENHHVSAFYDEFNDQRITGIEALIEAAKIKPKAAEIWLKQINKLDTKQLKEIVDSVPLDRITSQNRKFAKNLLAYNHEQLNNLRQKFFPNQQDLDNLYKDLVDCSSNTGTDQVNDIIKFGFERNISFGSISNMLQNNNSTFKQLIAKEGNIAGENLIREQLLIYSKQLSINCQKNLQIRNKNTLEDEDKPTLNIINKSKKQEVEKIAPILFEYLQLNQKIRVENERTIIQLNTANQSISYFNKLDKNEYLKAQYVAGKWRDCGSNISVQKAKYFLDEAAPKIKQISLSKQLNPSSKTKSKSL